MFRRLTGMAQPGAVQQLTVILKRHLLEQDVRTTSTGNSIPQINATSAAVERSSTSACHVAAPLPTNRGRIDNDSNNVHKSQNRLEGQVEPNMAARRQVFYVFMGLLGPRAYWMRHRVSREP